MRKKLIKQKEKQSEYLGKCLDTESPYDNLSGTSKRLWYSWHLKTSVEEQQRKQWEQCIGAGRHELEMEQQAFDIYDTAGRRIDSASSDFEKSQ